VVPAFEALTAISPLLSRHSLMSAVDLQALVVELVVDQLQHIFDLWEAQIVVLSDQTSWA